MFGGDDLQGTEALLQARGDDGQQVALVVDHEQGNLLGVGPSDEPLHGDLVSVVRAVGGRRPTRFACHVSK